MRTRRKQDCLILSALILASSTVTFYAAKTIRYDIPLRYICPSWTEMASEFRECLKINFRQTALGKLWSETPNTVTYCGSNSIITRLNVTFLTNSDDIKGIVLPRWQNHVYISVTAGVGNDILAEQKLQNLLPNTKFYGADPIEESGKVFRQFGKYYPLALSTKTAMLNSSVLLGEKYEWKEVESVELSYFLSKKLSKKYVDFLSLDIEGAEYDVLPQLLDEHNDEYPIICQINVELHVPFTDYNTNDMKFKSIIRNMISGPFVPIWTTPPQSQNHMRMFLINYQSDYCVNSFIYNHYYCK